MLKFHRSCHEFQFDQISIIEPTKIILVGHFDHYKIYKMRSLFTYIFILTLSYGFSQELGFSSFSPYGGNNSASNHELFFNTGEPITGTTNLDDLGVNNGLLNNVAFMPNVSSFLQVRFFFDKNENGLKDGEDSYLKLGTFRLNDLVTYSNYAAEGVILSSPEGDYQVDYQDFGLKDWLVTTEESFEVTLDEDNLFGVVEFGIAPEIEYADINVYLSSERFRCFSQLDYELLIENNGTTIEENIVWLSLDDRIDEIIWFEEPDIIEADRVGWNFELDPFETRTIKFSLKVPGIGDDIEPGDIFTQRAWVETSSEWQEFSYEQELRCSYDPNDKLVNPNRDDNLALHDTPITYTLRFQNTGNDYAEDVVVTDTLSEYLDISTFRLISTSHPDELQVIYDEGDNNIINFSFQNIFLPDSTTNEPGSNGFIMFTISPIEDLADDTEINNTGFIYFDFNPPIVTNTTETIMVEEFPVTSSEEVAIQTPISVFPNPTKGIVHFSEVVEQITLMDVNGKVMLKQKEVGRLDISDLPHGTYFINLINQGSSYLEKVVFFN